MSWLKSIENIGMDILKGVEIAGPIIGEFVPQAAPILAEVTNLIAAIEARIAAGETALTQAQASSAIQTVSAAHAIKQSVAAMKSS